MTRYVFDSYALLAFLEDEEGADIVEQALREILRGRAVGLLSVINWGEIYYIVMRQQGREQADSIMALIDQYPLTIVAADRQMTQRAARLKGRFALAFADCFAAALCQQHAAVLLTGDPEFRQLEGVIAIQWLA